MRLFNRKSFLLLSSLFLATSCYAVFVSVPPESAYYSEEKTAIEATPMRPVFVIKLKSNPTTGYSWFLRDYNATLIESVKHEFVPSTDKKLVGAPGYELWTFKVNPAGFSVPQQTTIRFVYTRPWEQNEETSQAIFKVSTMDK
jgi:inhibitor of cysteine peptidase